MEVELFGWWKKKISETTGQNAVSTISQVQLWPSYFPIAPTHYKVNKHIWLFSLLNALRVVLACPFCNVFLFFSALVGQENVI